VTVRDLAIGESQATLHFRRGDRGVEVGLSDVRGDLRLEQQNGQPAAHS
jgi:hypothetical protein